MLELLNILPLNLLYLYKSDKIKKMNLKTLTDLNLTKNSRKIEIFHYLFVDKTCIFVVSRYTFLWKRNQSDDT